MAKSFIVSPGRAYLVIAGEGTKIVRTNGTLIDTVPEGANAVSITVDSHEIIVMDNAAKIQQLYNGNSGSSGLMTVAEGEEAGSWKVEIVSALPEQGSAGVIYMVRTNRSGTDRYDDYIWIPGDNAYELLGRRPESTSVDLSGVAKTDVANTFTRSQQINGTLTTTSIVTTRLSCDQYADLSNASVSYMEYETAAGSTMLVNKVTVLTALSVDADAAIDLPGVTWSKGVDGDYIDVTIKPFVDAVEIRDTAKVSNVLTLGTGNIELDGRYGTLKVKDTARSVVVEPSSVQVLSTDATLTLKGAEITMKAGSEKRTVFSVTQANAGKFILNVSDGATLNGTVSMPGTLNVNNLNVTGTVTGIATGGGTTPTIDFSNGVTIMSTLTADDVIADTVTASTMSAGSSLSVSSESVIYRHSDGVLYVHGDIVTATKVTATTFLPTNIQGATFTGPLVMSKDNAIQVWNQGNTAEIHNGNITGFYYAQVDQCTVTHKLTMDEGKARSVTVTDTLVVKDLVVTGTTAGIPTGGSGGGGGTPSVLPNTVEGDLSVNGMVSAVSVLATSLKLNTISGTPGVNNAEFLVQLTQSRTPIVKLQNTNVGYHEFVRLEAPLITAITVLTEDIQVKDTLSARTVSADSVSVLNTLSADVVTADTIVAADITAPNLLTEDSLFTTVDALYSTPAGNADTLCRWAQIGSTHTMLEVGQLSSIMLPGPTVQKIPTTQNVTSFVLTLWYQADTAGNDIRLIGKSSNVVTPAAGAGSTNTWYFDSIEIKEEYLGRNLRLIMLPGTTTVVPSIWAQTVSNSEENKCYIQGRYTSISTDADCAVAASDSGATIYKAVLDATFKVSKKKPITGLTDEQTALLDWLAANKDALANLLASASSST